MGNYLIFQIILSLTNSYGPIDYSKKFINYSSWNIHARKYTLSIIIILENSQEIKIQMENIYIYFVLEHPIFHWRVIAEHRICPIR